MMANLGNVVNITANIATSAAVLILIYQIRGESRERSLSSFLYIHDFLCADELLLARNEVRTKLYRLPYEFWSDDQKEMANKVCVSYDQLGTLFRLRIVNKKFQRAIFDSPWGQSILDQFQALAPHLDSSQTPTQTGREYFRDFNWLYEQSAKRRQHGIGS